MLWTHDRSPRPALCAALLLSIAPAIEAQSKLQLKVFTSGPEGFSVNSTLIYVEKDAILIDAQFTLSEAQKLVATISETGKNLTTIYITHAHPDHYFGLAVLKPAFPNARIVALPVTVAGIKAGWDNRVKAWTAEFGGIVPPAGAILPEELQGNTLKLEGETLEILGGVQGDGPNNSFVWIPAIRGVVAGDIVFSGAYPPVAKNHDEWRRAIDRLTALKPVTVVPGHQVAGAKNDASTLDFMRNYMRDYDAALLSSLTAEDFKQKLKSQYSNLGLERLLDSSAQAAFPAGK
jgi:glyoxylase-like metal-dependent hydrolase (beta-lactamase superfamily II)